MIEVSAYSVQWAIDAQKAGAHRVELCDNIYQGGTTPSIASIELARKHLQIELYVIIRPRGGDFLYSDIEFETMKRDIEMAKTIGIDGFVFGLLNKDGSIDVERTKELVELSKPKKVTFHRAFDVARDPFIALEDIIICGCDRILTSGQKDIAPDALARLSELVKKAGNRISIMPGSGINENNILKIKKETKAMEFHLSGKKTVRSKMEFINKNVSFNAIGHSSIPEHAELDVEIIRKVIDLLNTKSI
ncbi:MAG: copper homeostasis protein CutC [Bacteroidetes bacterium]|nr:MAG: copper homeostasis protein CutC [Bacteroidota bacterium]